jgi:hypothetical protein
MPFIIYDTSVTNTFVEGFYDNVAHVGDLVLSISEEILDQSTTLPRTGEHWFKNKQVEMGV